VIIQPFSFVIIQPFSHLTIIFRFGLSIIQSILFFLTIRIARISIINVAGTQKPGISFMAAHGLFSSTTSGSGGGDWVA